MKVTLDASAIKDIAAIGEWIAKDNLRAAKAVVQAIMRTVSCLEMFPRMGHAGRAKGSYEYSVSGTPYIIVYEVWKKSDAVIVTAVFHGARER